VSPHEYHEKEEREKEEEMCGTPGVPARDSKQERKQKQRDIFLTTRRRKKNKMSNTLYPYNGQVDEVPRPVEETTGATSISAEGAFFATSDVSDVVATGEEVEETESDCTETCAYED
jgi:hypothetical protein